MERGGGTRAAAPWVRADWRRRRRTLVALAVLIGVAAGGVTAAVAGARRSATSLERLADAAGTSDVLVDAGEGGLPVAKRIAALPSVEAAAPVTLVFAIVDGVDADLGLFLPRGAGVGGELERDILLRGRRPDPGRPDEVLINEPMADIGGLDVGDVVTIHTLTSEQVAAEDYEVPLGPTVPAHVVGVTRGPGDLVARAEGNITAGGGLYPRMAAGDVDEFALYVAVRVQPDATVADFQRELRAAVPGTPLDVLPNADRTRPIRRAVSTLAVGLAVLAAVAAVAVSIAVAQAIARHVGGAAQDEDVLEALGLVRQQRVLALTGTVLPVAIAAPVAAVAVAIALSPLTPIGIARKAEPSPGVRLDPLVLVIGALATAALVAVAGIVAAVRAARPPTQQPLSRPSTAASAVGRLGMPPPVVHGTALAFRSRSAGRSARSSFAALAVAIVVAAGATTFAASLAQLRDASERWGSPWDLALDFTSADVDRAADQLVADPTLASVGRWDSGAAIVNGEYLRAVGVAPLRGEVGFTLVDGRQPGPGEIVIGPQTAERAGLEIGDRTTVVSPEGGGKVDGPALRVVGIALFPEVDDGDFVDGVGMTAGDFATHAAVTDLFEASQIVVRTAPGTSTSVAEGRLRKRFGGSLDEPLPVRPGAVGNLLEIGSIPRALVAFAAILALASLAHTVRSSAEGQAADFATLRAIGMTRRQRWECSLAQAVALMLAALLIGIPLGIAAGRAAWSAVASSIDVVPAPATAVLSLVLVVGGALVVAVVASVVGRIAPRRSAEDSWAEA